MKAMDEPNSILNVETLPGPLKAIRRKCLDCMNGNSKEVQLCPLAGECSLYLYRFGSIPEVKPDMSTLKAIRTKCLDCAGHDTAERRRCEFTKCPLWPYRLGHNPKLKGRGDISHFKPGNIGTTNDFSHRN